MPGRSPVQCRRTVARQLPTSNARLRVSDLGPNRAIRRCSQSPRGQSRQLGSYAGPLESRRRMGKRHMTGIIASVPPHQPNWHFAVATSIDSWKWQAPTTATQRMEKKQEINPTAVFNRLLHWLEGSGTEEPYIQPPSNEVHTRLRRDGIHGLSNNGELAVHAPIRIDSAFSSPPPPPPTPLEVLPQEVLELRQSICSLNTEDEDHLRLLCDRCCVAIKTRIQNGDLSITGLSLAFDPLDRITMDRLSPAMGEEIRKRVRGAIVRGVATAQATPGGSVPLTLWTALADKICRLDNSLNSVRLFRRMIDGMSEDTISGLDSEQLFASMHRFLSLGANKAVPPQVWLRYAGNLGKVLGRLTPAQQKDLDDRMQIYMQQDLGCPVKNRRLRSSWVMVKALHPGLSSEAVMNFYRAVMAPYKGLTKLELWQLTVAQLIRTKAVEGDLRRILLETKYVSLSHRWCKLLTLVLRTANNEIGQKEIKYVLQETGGLHMLVQDLFSRKALFSRKLDPNQMDTIQALAMVVDDHRLAYTLYSRVRAVHHDDRLTKLWRWETWIPYVERMIKDPHLEPRIWGLLRLGRDGQAQDPPQVIAAKQGILRTMALKYMEATHLSERQLLRRLDRCAACHRRIANNVPLDLIGLLTDIITRDLERGEWGRTARLVWVVQMVADNAGVRTAKQTMKSLAEWRRVIQWARDSLPADTLKRRLQAKE